MNKDKAGGVVRKFAKEKHLLQTVSNLNNCNRKKCLAVIIDRVM